MSVEDIASQISVNFKTQYTVRLKRPNFWASCYPRQFRHITGWITNHSIVYSLSNNSYKILP